MKKMGLFIPWLVVCIASLGSLFFSSIAHQEPCTLCWYQRVIMFPMVLILGIAAFRQAYQIILYVLPLSIIGLGISVYHVVMIKFFAQKNFCPECTLKSISNTYQLGFPLLSFTGFLVLNILLIWLYLEHRGSKKL